jgi:hypothetical protein
MSATCPTCGQAVPATDLRRITITDPERQGDFLVTLWKGEVVERQKEYDEKQKALSVAFTWRGQLPKAQRDLCTIDVQVDWDDYCDCCWQHYDHKEGYCRECNPSGAIA